MHELAAYDEPELYDLVAGEAARPEIDLHIAEACKRGSDVLAN
jgi:hypothetical protein